MTAQKLIELNEKIDEDTIEGFYSWDDFQPFEIDGVEISQAEQFGGMDQGSEYWVVIKVKEKDQEATYWKIPGWYQSHHGSELEFENIFEVVSKEKLVRVWVDAATGQE